MMRAKLDAANKETASGKGKRWEGSTRESLAFSADTIFGTGRNGAGSTKQYCTGVNPFKAPMGYKTKGVWSGEAPSGEGWFSAPVKTSKKTEGLRVLTPVREDEKQSSTVKMGKGRKVETEESGEYTCSSGSDWAARYTEEEKELSPVIKWGKTFNPVNKADAIACNHDWAYEFAQSRGDIRRADKVAIKEFGAHALQGSHHALVRALGIGAKYLAEGVIGVQYPSGLPRQAEAMRTGNIKQLAEYHGNCENQRRESEKRNA
ncbi:hypothetical protein GE061_011679 [Apolygus lucorum]|uniref:Uncharacterized protein n=1 Tax=Apolygus lucorum TaxID=248454 RepID=A0A8S9Y056_APOLU|nr:hypothetical protein GE061_011679 [Apolygus lucorum]